MVSNGKAKIKENVKGRYFFDLPVKLLSGLELDTFNRGLNLSKSYRIQMAIEQELHDENLDLETQGKAITNYLMNSDKKAKYRTISVTIPKILMKELESDVIQKTIPISRSKRIEFILYNQLKNSRFQNIIKEQKQK